MDDPAVFHSIIPASRGQAHGGILLHRQNPLIEEFLAVKGTSDCGRRVLDGVIIKNGEFRIAQQSEVSLEGKDVIVIQTKASRLGMYLMERVLFSAQLLHRFKPRSVVSVALCSQDDSALRPLLEQYPNMKVVICPRCKAA